MRMIVAAMAMLCVFLSSAEARTHHRHHRHYASHHHASARQAFAGQSFSGQAFAGQGYRQQGFDGQGFYQQGFYQQPSYQNGAQHHDDQQRRYAGVRTGRPAAWCGWYMRSQVGQDPGPEFNRAVSWARYGVNAGGPSVGAIVVWRHHVGEIVGQENGQWIVRSGNDGHAVRTRPRSLAGAIAFRRAYAMM